MNINQLPAYQASDLLAFVAAGSKTTNLASDHYSYVFLVAAGYATATLPLQDVYAAAGLSPGIQVPSGTVEVTYTPTPAGIALAETAR